MIEVLFVVGHPTQFEAPFFAHVSRTAGEDGLVVLFSQSHQVKAISDRELSRTVDWGFDLRAGYRSLVAPPGAGLGWAIHYLKASRPRYVIVNGYQIRLHRSMTLASHLLGIPIALRIDGALFAQRSRWKSIAKRLIYPYLGLAYCRMFSVGTVTDEYLESLGVARSALARFTYAVDVERFRVSEPERRIFRQSVRDRYGIPLESTILLSIAKFSERETPWDLVAVLPHLRSPDWSVLLVGDGPDRLSLDAKVKQIGPDVQVSMPGYVPYSELRGLYAAADIFVHPAQEEVWGMSVTEALAAGLPVIASDRVGAARDLIIQNQNGGVYPYGRADRLLDLLNEFRRRLQNGTRFEHINEQILQQWNYAATWRHIEDAVRLSVTE